MDELSLRGLENLKSHFVISSHGGRRTQPYAFTEHGAIMAASVLNSPKAVEMSVFVVRAFVNLRKIFQQYKELKEEIKKMESQINVHDKSIISIVQTIKELMEPKCNPKKEIGFRK